MHEPGREAVATRQVAVFVVDDHSIVLTGLRSLMNASKDFHVVGCATSASEARRLVPTAQPDLVLLDLRLGDALGPDLCRDLLRDSPETKVLILTGFSDTRILQACLDEGASGILLKGAPDLDILGAMRRALAGETVLDPLVAQELGAEDDLLRGNDGQLHTSLRPREYKVLRLMAQGLTTNDISQELGLTVNTIRSYAQALMQKLDVHSRIQLIVKARDMRLI